MSQTSIRRRIVATAKIVIVNGVQRAVVAMMEAVRTAQHGYLLHGEIPRTSHLRPRIREIAK